MPCAGRAQERGRAEQVVQELLTGESRPDPLERLFELRGRADEVGQLADGVHSRRRPRARSARGTRWPADSASSRPTAERRWLWLPGASTRALDRLLRCSEAFSAKIARPTGISTSSRSGRCACAGRARGLATMRRSPFNSSTGSASRPRTSTFVTSPEIVESVTPDSPSDGSTFSM